MKITLKFKGDITGLAGYQYGEKVYNEQVKDNINLNEEIFIEFPDNIERIASSFVQGFFSDIVSEIGLEGVEKNVKIITKKPKLTKSVYDNLY